MSNALSRIVVALILLPIVLGAVYLGGWWMFALVAVAALLSLHEFWLMARALSPLALAGYVAVALGLVGAEMSGLDWRIGGGLGFLILIRQFMDHGRLALVTVLLAVWAGDTLAYFGGRLLGRHKMAPTTSPGKTWEGFVFGTAATVFVAFVALYKQ